MKIQQLTQFTFAVLDGTGRRIGRVVARDALFYAGRTATPSVMDAAALVAKRHAEGRKGAQQ